MGARLNCFGIPDTYRGLIVQQGPDDLFFVARECGDERLMEAPTWDDLRDLIDEQADPFPQPQRRDGKEPCGECRLPVGETCDICGATA